ncbi:MAG TPA: hypothetical protein VEK15_08865 [Vicinamibacteria bacterium]|nr:hypothetical protein [Vicinamibacteria bacterium]
MIATCRSKLLIGTNLWIGATVAHDMALAARNHRHFRRVPGVKIADYRQAR